MRSAMLWLYESRCQLSLFSEFDTAVLLNLCRSQIPLRQMTNKLDYQFYWLFTVKIDPENTPDAQASTRPFPP